MLPHWILWFHLCLYAAGRVAQAGPGQTSGGWLPSSWMLQPKTNVTGSHGEEKNPGLLQAGMQACFISHNWNDKSKRSPCLWWSQRASPHQFLRSVIKRNGKSSPVWTAQGCRLAGCLIHRECWFHRYKLGSGQLQTAMWLLSRLGTWPVLFSCPPWDTALLLPPPLLLGNPASSLFFLAYEWPLKQCLLVLTCWDEGPRSQRHKMRSSRAGVWNKTGTKQLLLGTHCCKLASRLHHSQHKEWASFLFRLALNSQPSNNDPETYY